LEVRALSVLRFKVSELESGQKRINDIEGRLLDTIATTSKENLSFSSVQSGDWAEAQAKASVNIETNARIFSQAMAQLGKVFVGLVCEAKTIQGNRDALMSEAGASVAFGDMVECDTDGRVGLFCDEAREEMADLSSKAGEAIAALSGLRGAGGITGSLSSLQEDLSQQQDKVQRISKAWARLQSSASEFESTYSSGTDSTSLDKGKFIDSGMISATRDAMADEYGMSGAARANSAATSVTKSDTYKWAKRILGTLGSTLGHADAFGSAVSFAGYAKGLASGAPGTFLLNVVGLRNDEDHSFDRAALAIGAEATGFNASFFGTGAFKSRFFERLDDARLSSEAIDAYENLRDGGKEIGAYLSSKLCKKASVVADDMDGLASATPALDDAASLGSSVGKLAKGAGKALGFVGDVVTIADTFQKSKEAYQTTSGDRAQKSAAAMVEGGEGLVKWGVGKVVGAAVGACFGGPVGAVAGMAIGCGVDFLLDQGQKIFDNSQAKQDMINTVASAQRESPSTTFAFAPQ
jgi:hypothetical protein